MLPYAFHIGPWEDDSLGTASVSCQVTSVVRIQLQQIYVPCQHLAVTLLMGICQAPYLSLQDVRKAGSSSCFVSQSYGKAGWRLSWLARYSCYFIVIVTVSVCQVSPGGGE